MIELPTVRSGGIRVHLRWMIRIDIRDVANIEALSNGLWTENDILARIRKRNCIGMVAEYRNHVVGFTVYSLLKERLHLNNFAVHPSWRRYGVGRQLCDKLISKLCRDRRTAITINVPDDRLDAQLFFRQQGFKAVEVLHTDHGDKYKMEYSL